MAFENSANYRTMKIGIAYPEIREDNEPILWDFRTSNVHVSCTERISIFCLGESCTEKVKGCTLPQAARSATLAFTSEATIIVKRRCSTIPHPSTLPPFHPRILLYSPLPTKFLCFPPSMTISRPPLDLTDRSDLPSRLHPFKVNSNTLECDQNGMGTSRSGGERFECLARELRGNGKALAIVETLLANVVLSFTPS